MNQSSTPLWLDLKTNYIDDNFEKLVEYLRSTVDKNDSLYKETLKLLEKRIEELIDIESSRRLYDEPATHEETIFNIKLLVVYLLTIRDDAKFQIEAFIALMEQLMHITPRRSQELLNKISECLRYTSIDELGFGWYEYDNYLGKEVFVMNVCQNVKFGKERALRQYANQGTLLINNDNIFISSQNIAKTEKLATSPSISIEADTGIHVIISQADKQYLDALIRYNKALEQRNSMIRHDMRDPLLYETVEQQMCVAAELIHRMRRQWVEQFTPIFMEYYHAVAGADESVAMRYDSPLNGGVTMEQVLHDNRERDMIIGHTTRGVHRDDLELLLAGHSMRRTGSQGQCKTYTIALRLAQFDFIKAVNPTTPILLLDDIFDRLDALRVERIVDVVSGDRFGQIFITDTNRTHLDQIIQRQAGDYRMMTVEHGVVTADPKGGNRA